MYEKLADYHQRWACDEFNDVFPELAVEAGFGPKQIPQISAISEYFSRSFLCIVPRRDNFSVDDYEFSAELCVLAFSEH